MLFYYLLLFLCCFCVVWKYLLRRKSDLDPPEIPSGYPFIGNVSMFFNKNHYKEIVKLSEECLRKGGLIRGSIFYKNIYAITDPEDFFTVSKTCLEKLYLYNFMKPFMGEGLITGNVSTWEIHRKLLNPAFNQRVLNSFIETFNSQARSLVDRLAFQLEKSFDHENLIREINLETLCLTISGVNIDTASDRDIIKMYLSIFPRLVSVFDERIRKIWLHIDFIFNLSRLKKFQDVMLKQFLTFSSAIIQKKKAALNCLHKKDTVTNKLKPFLELILDIANETQSLTDDEVREEVDSVIAAGYETSPAALNMALIILGSYPDVQEKVYNEIIQVCGGSDKDLDKDDLSKLVYTEAVLKETLRLHPVAPVIARRTDKDIKLKNYMLKRDSFCFLLIYGLNRHPVWGPDANEFKPERWFDTATLPDMNCFGSFGVGKRNCIGKVYAMMSMKIHLAHVIRRYRVSSDLSKLVFNWHVTTHFESGHHYILKRRE